MMAEAHPTDVELLEYVEGDLPRERRRELGAHVAGCAACAGSVRELEAGRDALRSAPLLELPRERRRELDAALTARTEARRTYVSPMRLATVLVPIAAVALAVSAIVGLSDRGGDDAGGNAEGAAAGMTGAAQDGGGGGGDSALGGESAPGAGSSGPAVESVKGPPRRVATKLRAQGFSAKVVDGAVLVQGAKAEAVRRALADEPGGAVEVYVE